MNQTTRDHGLLQHNTGEPADPAPGGQLEAIRADADRLLRAADDAIARALSEDSELYLESTRQSGGQ